MRNILLLMCLYAFGELTSSSSVSFISKCSVDDNKCVKKSTQAAIPIYANGIPELGIESLEPLLIDRVDASTPNLNLVASDLVIDGLRNCIAKKVQIDRKGSSTKMALKLQCTVELNGHYDMKGQILILPIEGKGKVHASIRKIVIAISGEMEDKVGKDGDKFWDIKNWKHTFELKDRCDLNFENLFNGNEVLGQAAREVINSSANEVILEIGPPIITAIVTKIVNSVQALFYNVPIKDLII
uniref:Putative odorant binding protein 8 n=1 Tax=Corcyra cephalonica TaxID=139036 RepID=A0A8K1UB74_CORCP|nr:putative odorant binding protein 8 [Corcyra cephalonica]